MILHQPQVKTFVDICAQEGTRYTALMGKLSGIAHGLI